MYMMRFMGLSPRCGGLSRSDVAGQAQGRRLCCELFGFTVLGIPARNVINPFRIELGGIGGQWFPLFLKKSVEAELSLRLSRMKVSFEWQ
jgi:hypothetical protein